MNKQFIISGNTVNIIDTNTTIHNELPVGIYQIKSSMSGLYLDKIANKFDLGIGKKYDVSDGLADKIKKFWKYTQKSLGVLFVGPKGCGKTFTAKMLAADLNLPVILVTDYNDGLQEFISNIAGRAVIIFDEFEKVFDKDDEQLEMLTVLDGLYSASADDIKMFIFTANYIHRIDDNFISRPSRIRYLKNFGNLSVDVVRAIVDDNLKKDIARKEEIINYINDIRYITVDVVKAIIDEINLFGFKPDELNKTMNIQHKTYEYLTYKAGYYEIKSEFLENYKKFKESGSEEDAPTRMVVVSDCRVEDIKVGMRFNDEEVTEVDGNVITTVYDDGVSTVYVVESLLNPRSGISSINAF